MSGKSRKGATSSRSSTGTATPQTTNPTQGAASVSQASMASASGRRPSPLVWIGLVVAGLLALYAALLFFAPSVLPDWIRPVPAPTPPALAGPGRISFVRASDNGSSRDLFVMNADGTNQQQVTNDIYVEGSATWSPDGRQMLAQAAINGLSTVVRLTIGQDNKSTDAVQLTADTKADSVLPVWSPDGKQIAYQSKMGGSQYQVFVMDADGNNKRRVSDGNGYAGQPDWSPDGKTIAYISGKDASEGTARELFTVSPSGDNPKQITNLNATLGTPVWSPDSKTIAFLQIVGQQDNRLMIVNADGTNTRTLAQNGAIKYQQFSPSGDQIAYSNVVVSGNGIYKVGVADGAVTTVRAGDDYQPTWSPDGNQLAWASTQPGNQQHKIAVANADGSDMKIVSQGDGDDYQPAWSTVK